jgi:hypothetical protein
MRRIFSFMRIRSDFFRINFLYILGEWKKWLGFRCVKLFFLLIICVRFKDVLGGHLPPTLLFIFFKTVFLWCYISSSKKISIILLASCPPPLPLPALTPSPFRPNPYSRWLYFTSSLHHLASLFFRSHHPTFCFMPSIVQSIRSTYHLSLSQS